MEYEINSKYIPKSKLTRFNRSAGTRIPKKALRSYDKNDIFSGLLTRHTLELEDGCAALAAYESPSRRYFKVNVWFQGNKDNEVLKYRLYRFRRAVRLCTGRKIRITPIRV